MKDGPRNQDENRRKDCGENGQKAPGGSGLRLRHPASEDPDRILAPILEKKPRRSSTQEPQFVGVANPPVDEERSCQLEFFRYGDQPGESLISAKKEDIWRLLTLPASAKI